MTNARSLINRIRGVIQINTNGRILGVVPERVAIVRLLNEEVISLEDSGRVMRSAGGLEVPIPVVVMELTHMPEHAAVIDFADREASGYGHRSLSSRAKFRVLARDNFRCGYCEAEGFEEVCTVDHIVPQAAGGSNHWSNLVACCGPCNSRKADATEGWKVRFPIMPVERFNAERLYVQRLLTSTEAQDRISTGRKLALDKQTEPR